MYKFICCLCIYLTMLSVIVNGYGKKDVKKLKTKLFDEAEYDTSIRPIADQRQAIKVDILFSLVSIVDFDMDNGKFEASGYYLARWFDDALVWNSSEHAGITRLQLQTDSVWTPQMTQINTVGEHFLVSAVFVESSGIVTWITTGEFRSFCELHMRYYPEDKHTCDISLVSSKYETSDVVLIPISNEVGTENMQRHGKWKIENTKVKSVLFVDKNTGLSSSTLINSIVLKRIARFDMVHKCVPIFLLVLANSFVHVVPLLSGERISFSVTVLLALVFWQAIIVDDLPKNSSQISFMSIIMTLSIVTSTLSVVFSVFLCRLAHEQDRPIPKYLKKIAWRRKYRKRQLKSREYNGVLTLEDRIRNEKALPAMKMNSFGETENNTDDSINTGECNEIDVVWLDVAETLDVAIGVLSVIVLLIIFSVFIIIFNVK